MMNELVLATSNSGKIKELQELLSPIVCIAQDSFNIPNIEETGLSFIENAILKARNASFYTKKPALADDSGLVVPALNGEPGIYSARYAGVNAKEDDNLLLLLKNMDRLKGTDRNAFFYCAIALVHYAEDPTPIISTGIFHGQIAHKPSGNRGFGYDPLFYIEEYQCTAAELPSAIKNTLSHRAQALNHLLNNKLL